MGLIDFDLLIEELLKYLKNIEKENNLTLEERTLKATNGKYDTIIYGDKELLPLLEMHFGKLNYKHSKFIEENGIILADCRVKLKPIKLEMEGLNE